MSQTALIEFTNWLQKRHEQIRLLEKEGYAALNPDNDQPYREKMRKKADLLAALHTDAAPYLAKLAPAVRGFANDETAIFSANAKEAIQLNSVFYMAQLLYPEDYKDGEPDNFELFMEELKEFSS